MAYLSDSDPLWQELASLIEDEGLCLYDVEKMGDSMLRISIDAIYPLSSEQDEGRHSAVRTSRELPAGETERRQVSSGDCSRVCKRLIVFFTVEGSRFGLIKEPQLEVSSPGVNRRLRLRDHFRGAVGQRVKVLSTEKGDRQSAGNVTGRLDAFENDLLIVVDERTSDRIELSLGEVKKANVDFDFDRTN